MKTRAEITRRAWQIARELTEDLGGTARDHLSEGMRMAWDEAHEAEAKAQTEAQAEPEPTPEPMPIVPAGVITPMLAEPERDWMTYLMYMLPAWLAVAGAALVALAAGITYTAVLIIRDYGVVVIRVARWTGREVRRWAPVVAREVRAGWQMRKELLDEAA